MTHQFHIPVLGLAFSIDTPIKVAHYGITSVMSIVDDELIERMRQYHCEKAGLSYEPINKDQEDHRAIRITAYLNMVGQLVSAQMNSLRSGDFNNTESGIHRYFNYLPDGHPLKLAYLQMKQEQNPDRRRTSQTELREAMSPGNIEVNIMSKVDKMNNDHRHRPLNDYYSDAMAALRGAALSDPDLSLVLSAGMNPRLYAYLGELSQFKPDSSGKIRKRIILKVSDYRSALIQAKFLAKKGIWISEFRIESGLNCGGHAFATDGFLLGPILQEFKEKRPDLLQELHRIYGHAMGSSPEETPLPQTRITVQGGIGTYDEQQFLIQHYQLDGTGWGSPFLLVPEATTVDDQTLLDLAGASTDDFYVSGASPLGVPFNNFRHSSAEKQRQDRIAANRPGSPCTKKYLVSNTEFTKEPICTASRKYQHLKIKQLQSSTELSEQQREQQLQSVLEKTCLCEGLATSAYLKNDMLQAKENAAVAICPGPNLAWFNRTYALKEMIDHVYGRVNLLAHTPQRPNLFVNELELYMQHLHQYIADNRHSLQDKKTKYIDKFKNQLKEGIRYYESLCEQFPPISPIFGPHMLTQIQLVKIELDK